MCEAMPTNTVIRQYQATVTDFEEEEQGVPPRNQDAKLSAGDFHSPPSNPQAENSENTKIDSRLQGDRSGDSGYASGSQQSTSVVDQLEPMIQQQPRKIIHSRVSRKQLSERRDRVGRPPIIPHEPVPKRRPIVRVGNCAVPGCTRCGPDAIEPRTRPQRLQPVLDPTASAVELPYPPRNDTRSTPRYEASSSRVERPAQYYAQQDGPVIHRAILDPRRIYHESEFESEAESDTESEEAYEMDYREAARRLIASPEYGPRELASKLRPSLRPASITRAFPVLESTRPKPSQTIVIPTRSRKRDTQSLDCVQDLRPNRRSSVSRPPYVYPINSRSANETRQARVILEGSRSSRRIVLQTYDRAFQDHRQPRQQEINEQRIKSPLLSSLESQHDDTPQARFIEGDSKVSRRWPSRHFRSKRAVEATERALGDDDEIRLRIGNGAPTTLYLKGDMEGRSLRLVPVDDEMNELIVSSKSQGGAYFDKGESAKQGRIDLPSLSQTPRSTIPSSGISSILSQGHEQLNGMVNSSQILSAREHATVVIHGPPSEPIAIEGGGNYADEFGDEADSTVPSYAASVFSVESLASSASALPNNGNYSEKEIATATRKLIVIVSEDAILVELYKSAVDNPAIGPARLQKRLHRLFKAYADNLRDKGEGRLEYLASRLVATKAPDLAKYIVEKFQPRQSRWPLEGSEQQEESSDEDDWTTTVNDDMFDDLKLFADFLVGGAAFQTLRAQVQSFVLPKLSLFDTERESRSKSQERDDEQLAKPQDWRIWLEGVRCMIDSLFLDPIDAFLGMRVLFLVVDFIYLTTDPLFIHLGQLEPPLSRHMVRLRWKSVSFPFVLSRLGGAKDAKPQQKYSGLIFSDIVEHRDNGISNLTASLQQSVGAKVMATAFNHQTGNQMYLAPQPFQWLRNGIAKITAGANISARAGPCIPLHNAPSSSVVGAALANVPSPRSILHLMTCMHRDCSRKMLKQDLLEDVNTDRELFRFMRRQIHTASWSISQHAIFQKRSRHLPGQIQSPHRERSHRSGSQIVLCRKHHAVNEL